MNNIDRKINNLTAKMFLTGLTAVGMVCFVHLVVPAATVLTVWVAMSWIIVASWNSFRLQTPKTLERAAQEKSPR